jgi:putative ABC transport system substrate-binding protein
MDRRAFISGITGGLLVAPLAVGAQPGKIPRLCFLTFDPGTPQSSRFDAFFQGLRDLGYVDGQTITIDYLSAATSQAAGFPALATECLRVKADIIVVTTTPAAQAAKHATHTIPIVMHSLGDPMATGLVASLARPGGNVTGTTLMASGLAAKRLGLLKEIVPRISRVLVLSYLVDPVAAPQVKELESAAHSLGVKLLVRDIRTPDDLSAAFDAGAREHAEGVLTTAESIFVAQRNQVVQLAAQHRLPGMYPYKLMVDAGGLMAYDSYTSDLQRRVAAFVDKILKGAKPADLPVEQPTKVELVINLKAAKALGLTARRCSFSERIRSSSDGSANLHRYRGHGPPRRPTGGRGAAAREDVADRLYRRLRRRETLQSDLSTTPGTWVRGGTKPHHGAPILGGSG